MESNKDAMKKYIAEEQLAEAELQDMIAVYFGYDDHDCHLSPNDSCEVCEKYYKLPNWLRK